MSRIVDFRSGEFLIRADTIRAYRNGLPLSLRLQEIRLLLLFLQNRGKVLKRSDILKAIGSTGMEDERFVDVYVMRLRKVLRLRGHHDPIETVKMEGYRFRTATGSSSTRSGGHVSDGARQPHRVRIIAGGARPR